MKTSWRFEQAVKKLYVAFHQNELHPECCKQCAVGNILVHREDWKHLVDHHGSLTLNYVGHVNELMGKKFNGYSPSELIKIEAIFLKACGYNLPLNHKNKRPKNPIDKDILFNGLCDVISHLCELDKIENVMDYTKIDTLKTSHTFIVLYNTTNKFCCIK